MIISGSILAGLIGGVITTFTLLPTIKSSFKLTKDDNKKSTVSSVDLEFEVKNDD